MDYLNAAFMLLVIGTIAYRRITGPARHRRAIEASFHTVRFPSSDGALTGAQVEVIRRRLGTGDAAPFHAFQVDAFSTEDEFWYCKGPGPCWFLAIPMTTQTWSGWKIEWIVRPLDAARMRGALAGDDEALRRAFGDVVHDTLHA